MARRLNPLPLSQGPKSIHYSRRQIRAEITSIVSDGLGYS